MQYHADAELGLNGSLYLVPLGAPEPIFVAAAKQAFFKASPSFLVRLAEYEGLAHVAMNLGEQAIVEAMLKRYLGEAVDAETLYDLILLRAPDLDCYDSVFLNEDFLELIDKSDHQQLDLERKRIVKKQAKARAFRRSLAPLKRRVHAALLERLRLNPYDAEACAGPDASPSRGWTQETVNRWAPPRSHIYRDELHNRWRARFPPRRDMSRSWQLYGYENSLKMILRAMWTAAYNYASIRCPVQGIFADGEYPEADAAGEEPGDGLEDRPLAPEDAQPAAAREEGDPPAAGRGARGRGRRGRGRQGGAGRGRRPAAAAAPASSSSGSDRGEPAVPPPVGASSSGSSSSSSSSS